MTLRFLVATLLGVLLFATLAFNAFHTPSVFSAPPAQDPVSTPTLKPGDRTYTVQAGDSYWSIAQKVYNNGNKYNLILQANNLTDKSKLRVGMVLVIPALPGTGEPVAPTGPANVPGPVTPTALPILQPSQPSVPTAIPTINQSATQPTAVPTLPPVSVVARSQQTDTQITPADPAASRTAINLSSELKNQQLLTALDILSGIFAATSVICAFLAYQAYLRAKHFEKMVIVRRRARSHADLI